MRSYIRFMLTMGFLAGVDLVAATHSAEAADAQAIGCSTRGINLDCNFVVLLAPPATAIPAGYIDQRIQQIQNLVGPNGSRVEITLRNGSHLYLFDVFGR